MSTNLINDNEQHNSAENKQKLNHRKTFISKIILSIIVCISIILVACGSTLKINSQIAWTLMGSGIGLVIIAIGVSIFIFINESKQKSFYEKE